jgi:hypothetical protein
VLEGVDRLSPEDLETLYRHVVQRRHASYWLVPGEHLKRIPEVMQPVYEQTDHMNEDEINAAIDDALNEVRLELTFLHILQPPATDQGDSEQR